MTKFCAAIKRDRVSLLRFSLLSHYYHFTLLRVFHTSVCWWFSTIVWVTASLLNSPELYSVFCPNLTRLKFGWCPIVILFPYPLVPLPNIWWLYRAHQLQLVSPSLSRSIDFWVLEQGLGIYLFFRFLSVLLCDLLERQSSLFGIFSLFLLFYFFTITKFGRLAKIRWSVCVSNSLKNSGELSKELSSLSQGFNTSLSWWSFTRVTASLLKSPGLSWVF